MKTFWKILSLGALAAGLTPYKVETDEETGEKSYQALLWRITSAPAGEDKKIGINLSEGTLTSKLLNAANKEEPHLFSDELSVEYVATKTEEASSTVAETGEKSVETVEEAVEPAEPEEPAEPQEPKAE